VKLVQDRHLESIRAASFLWLVCPDGHVGQSASLEVGYAIRDGVPIFATHTPSDLTLREYVTVVPTISEALGRVRINPRGRRSEGLLIDPHASVEEAHNVLERIETALTGQKGLGDPARQVSSDMANLRNTLGVPTRMQ
jgi:hypothetical protein